MEVFKVLFCGTDERVNENEFHFANLRLRRAPSRGFNPDDFGLFKKSVPILCSQEVAIGDGIIVLHEKNFPKSFAKVISIDSDGGFAEIEFTGELILNGRFLKTGHDNRKSQEPLSKCFYPIIEIKVDEGFFLEDCDEVNRENLEFKTLCSKCMNEVRQPENCQTHKQECEKTNKTHLALIK